MLINNNVKTISKKIIILVFIILTWLLFLTSQKDAHEEFINNPLYRTYEVNPPENYATLVTNKGNITIKLSENIQSKALFVHLAKEGYYDNMIFNRILEGYILQVGQRLTSEMIDYWHSIPLESNSNNTSGDVLFVKAEDKKGASRQFMIVTGEISYANNKIGKVVNEDKNILGTIQKNDTIYFIEVY